MALVLEPAASAAIISHHAPAVAPSPSPNLGTQASLVLPRSTGLKVFFSARRSAAGINRHPHRSHVHAARVIVGEQQQEVIAPAGAVTDKTWKELVLESDIPVLVDFWAPWCGPCRMIAPVVDELAKLYAGRIRCFKLNTDESPSKATEYGIRSIPTVLIFKGGEKKDSVVGAVPKATLIATIEKFLDRCVKKQAAECSSCVCVSAVPEGHVFGGEHEPAHAGRLHMYIVQLKTSCQLLVHFVFLRPIKVMASM